MTREEFIKRLDKEGFEYMIEGDKIVITHSYGGIGQGRDDAHLVSLVGLVEFRNKGIVDLYYLTSLPPDTEFNNGGRVNLNSLTSLPPSTKFNNGGDINLDSLTSLPPGVKFNNRGDVYLGYLIGTWLDDWKGNIDGIDSKRLLNLMISKGVFER